MKRRQDRTSKKVDRLREQVKVEQPAVNLGRFGLAGLRIRIDEMLESHHGRPLPEWRALGKDGLKILYMIASGDEEHPFRDRSIAILGELTDDGALPYLAEILKAKQEHRITRIAAARAIGDIAGPAALKILGDNLQESDDLVRHKVVQALGKVADVRSVGWLRQAASGDSSDLVRNAASNALQRIALIHNLELK